MNPSPRLALRMLGGFALERDALPCKLAYVKGRALLAFLAAEPGRAHSRESLATMLWPDMIRELALTNFRQVLHDLRHTLNAASLVIPPLQVDRETIRLDPSSDLVIDTTAFFAPAPACLAMPCPANCASCCERMETLAGYYRGEFMADFSLPECLDFEEWLQTQREALHLRAIALLARLSDCHERMGAHARSLPFALRFLELEPWNEEGLRRAMRLYALNRQRDAALTRYETCCRALKNELGVSPSEETVALAERIRRGDLSPDEDRMRLHVPTAVLPLPVTERRQVTVLYCELVPVGMEDPDEALALLCAPQARCNKIIRSHSGHLVQVHGGGFLAYFGYPQANENAARKAVQAALAVTCAAFPGIELRACIHTGLVISGGDQQVPDAIGATSGLAIRLRQQADYGGLVISSATQHLVAGYFECLSLGLRQFPGIVRPLEVFRVNRESGATSRLDASARLTPLVGRQKEIATLLTAWQDACGGVRRVVLLRGEAGIGKSRLVLALKHASAEQIGIVRELRCYPEHSQSPFFPLAALLGDAPAAASRQQREQAMADMLDRLYALAARRPLLLVIEDLHWVDPSTLEFLMLFVARQRAAPILAVFTARLEFQPTWPGNLARTLTLNALDDAETVALIAAVAPQIEPATARRIVERADGVPLFVEEMAKIADREDPSGIPATLHDLLAARLDRMGVAKRTAQLAATIGREFDLYLLRKLAAATPANLENDLDALQDAGLILKPEQEGAGSSRQFKHALIQEAAYQSQIKADQQAAHRRIAQVLQSDFPAVAAAQPELLARHLTAGGETRPAIDCWIKAGQRACRLSASKEAVTHFESGLALLETLPDDAGRARLELDLQIGLGTAACAAQGYASAQGAAAYARAMALCGEHESGPDMFNSVWGLWASASSRAGYPAANKLARQLLRMAGQGGDPVQAQQAHFALADTLYWQGEFATASDHLDHVAARYRPVHHASHIANFGEDAGVTGGAYRAWVLLFLGYPDQARRACAEALTLARQLGHPFSLAYALTFAAILHCRLRLPAEAEALAKETLELAQRHGYPLWQIGATLTRGWALAMQNRSEGVEIIRQCVEATRAAMGGVTLVVLEPLVDANTLLGLNTDALTVGEEALTIGKTLGDHHADAELHRLKGEALLGLDGANAALAEAAFRKALTISRKQGAKSLELRAAMSLARLWRKQGKRDEARRLLTPVFGWFTEGFDTPDLQDASALLDALGSAR